MDRTEAAALLRRHMDRLAETRYGTWAARIGEPWVDEARGPGGAVYQIEVEAFWDSEPGGLIRVLGSIDDGTLRAAFRPVCEGFLIDPDDVVDR